MQFPKQFLDAKRWMVRPNGKRPISAFESRPIDYEPPGTEGDPNSSYWRWRWNVPAVLAKYEQAKSYLDRHSETTEGLTFVLHPFGNYEPRTRLICLDWDKSIKGGVIDPAVEEMIGLIDSFTEYSRSGRGAHTFLLVEDCPAFGNLLQRDYKGTKVDVLCSNPVAVTGNVIGDFTELETVPYSFLEALPFFEFKEPSRANYEKPEWWTEEPLDGVPEHLREFIPHMESVTAVEGEGGSLTLFAAACRLMRHGVTGREAEALLRCVPAIPPFEPDQIQRTVECAFNQTTHDGEFNVPTPEFPILEEPTPPDPDEVEEEDREKLYGYKFITADELLGKDLKLEYLVDQAFVGHGGLFIGGDQKTFKTGLAMDLLVSLATKTPFLNHFEVLSSRSAAIFTAEIGEIKAQILLKSILQSRGLTRCPGLDIVNEVPQFGFNRSAGQIQGDAIQRLKRYFQTRKPQVAVFDPLYLTIVGGDAGDMYGMGAVLNKICEICNRFEVWPIFCHHSKKLNGDKEFQPMRLNDFYGSGPAQYARQWLLVSHSEPFRSGVANLYATIGGSTQSREDLYEIKIDEGVTDILADRRWDVTVSESNDEVGSVSRTNVLAALDGLPAVSPAELAVHLNCTGRESSVQKVLHELVREGEVMMQNKKFKLSDGGFPA